MASYDERKQDGLRGERLSSKFSKYIYVCLGEELWVFAHHVGKMSFSNVEFPELLFDKVIWRGKNYLIMGKLKQIF